MSNKNDSFKCIQIINGATNERPDLDNHIEEADMRIIPHIAKSIESGLKNVVVVSNDTDACVLLLNYTPQLIESGLTELWLKYGVGPRAVGARGAKGGLAPPMFCLLMFFIISNIKKTLRNVKF